MNELSLDSILEVIHSISKEIIQKKFPEEKEFFDTIWEAMKGYISQWKEKLPDELQTYEYQEKLKEDLGFLDEAEISKFNTPKVIALISLVWLRLVEQKGQVQDVNIEETFTKYGKSLPEWVRLKTTRFAVPMIKDDLKNIGRISVAEAEEEKKYVIYSHDNRKGEAISESGYQMLMKMDKRDYLIWMDEIKKIFKINNKEYKIRSRSAEVLKYLIQKKGMIANYQELFEKFSDLAKDPENYKKNEDWDKSLNIYVYRWISAIHTETEDRLKDFIVPVRERGYRIAEEDEEAKYCLIDYLKK